MDTTSVNPETANYLDGPGLYAWLEEVDGLENMEERLGGRRRKAINAWRDGETACLYGELGVDNILIRLGRHICEVPADLYRPDPAPDNPDLQSAA